MVWTIRCLDFLFFFTTALVRTRIIQWSIFWTWSRREEYLGQLLCASISRDTQRMTVTAHLTAFRCCNGSKMSLFLRSSVKLFKLFKRSMNNYLTSNNYWVIYTTDLILKLSTSIMSSKWKIFGTYRLLSKFTWQYRPRIQL